MNFLETIKSMNYEILEKSSEQIIIVRTIDYCQVRIAFFLKSKKVHGVMTPLSVIMSKNDLKRMAKSWEAMTNDIKTLAELSHYDIME